MLHFTTDRTIIPRICRYYSFSIEPEDKRSHIMDRRIAITIAEILKRFFAVNTNAMIMVCDSTDGKEFKRRKLFDRWFEHFSDDSILKYDASLLYQNISCLFLYTLVRTIQTGKSYCMLFQS